MQNDALMLHTKRLVLRPFRDDDAMFITEILGDYEVSKWLAPVPYPYLLEDAHSYLSRVSEKSERQVLALDFQGRFIGSVSVGPSLGYYLHPDYWGQGLMSEAVHAVLKERFSEPDVEYVRSYYFEGNDGSRRVLEKAGFVSHGIGTSFSDSRQEEVPSVAMLLSRNRWSRLSDSRE